MIAGIYHMFSFMTAVLQLRLVELWQKRSRSHHPKMLCTLTQGGFSRIFLLSRFAYHTLRRNGPHLYRSAVLQGWKVLSNHGGLVHSYLKQEEATNSFFRFCKWT